MPRKIAETNLGYITVTFWKTTSMYSLKCVPVAVNVVMCVEANVDIKKMSRIERIKMMLKIIDAIIKVFSNNRHNIVMIPLTKIVHMFHRAFGIGLYSSIPTIVTLIVKKYGKDNVKVSGNSKAKYYKVIIRVRQ